MSSSREARANSTSRTADPTIWARWPWELWALHLISIAIGAAATWLAIYLSR